MKQSMMALLLLAGPLFAAPDALRSDAPQRLVPAQCRFAYMSCTFSCGDDSVCWENCGIEYNACLGIHAPESLESPADASMNRD